MANFIERCRAGTARPEDIDDFIDQWHKNPGTVSLYTFLGMTKGEYTLWISSGCCLSQLVKARVENFNFGSVRKGQNQ